MENKKFVLLSMIDNDFSMPQFFDTLADAQEEMSKEYNEALIDCDWDGDIFASWACLTNKDHEDVNWRIFAL